MVRIGKAVLGLGAAAALIACGGSDGTRADPLDDAAWTLTIVTPGHGAEVQARTRVEVAVSGDAAATGASPPFEFGFFVDDELVAHGRDASAELALQAGERILRVEGVGPDGALVEGVLGDEISVNVAESLDPGPVEIPDDLFEGSGDGAITDPPAAAAGAEEGPMVDPRVPQP